VHSRIQESAATITTPTGKEQPDVPVERLDMMIASAEGRALGASNNECFVLFPGDDALAGEVRSLPGVVYVEQNLPVTANHHQYEIASWGLDRIDQGDRQLPLNEAYDPAYTGKGVSVYVFDTGVDVNNVEFEGRASHGPSFAGASSDVGEHGSHVAGTVASKTFGVAKEATIVDVKVLTAKGDGNWWKVMHGIKWAIDNAPVPSVFTLSLGSKERGISQAVNDAVDAAFAKGHIVTVAAGNSNDDACFYSPSGAGGRGRVITVMASDKADSRASFSSYGPCCDIFAPGVGIKSLGGSKDGTSMATPHVAGVAAQLLQKNFMNREAALRDLFALAKYVISDSKNSPYNLLQTPRTSTVPTLTDCYWTFCGVDTCDEGYHATDSCRWGFGECPSLCGLAWQVSLPWQAAACCDKTDPTPYRFRITEPHQVLRWDGDADQEPHHRSANAVHSASFHAPAQVAWRYGEQQHRRQYCSRHRERPHRSTDSSGRQPHCRCHRRSRLCSRDRGRGCCHRSASSSGCSSERRGCRARHSAVKTYASHRMPVSSTNLLH
jgi:hypothetical protein